MKNIYSFLLLALFGFQFQTIVAQLYIAPSEHIYAGSGAVFTTKEALSGDAQSLYGGPGEITIDAATLRLNPNVDFIGPSIIHTNNNAIITTEGIAANRDFTVGPLDMQGSTTIALASNTVHTLRFSPSGGYNWQGVLTITGWQGGFDGTSGTKGRIFFGDNQWGLEMQFHVGLIKFFDGVYTHDAQYLPTGEVVPKMVIQTAQNTAIASSLCLGSSSTVEFTYNSITNFGSSTTFTAQLSNESGSFASPTSIGTVAGNASGSQTVSITIPSSLTGGAGYRIRVVSDAPGVTGSDNGVDIYIKAFSAGAISSTGESICAGGTPIVEIASSTAASGGDNSISYSWRSSADNYTAAISGATGSTFTPPSGLTTATSYRRYANDGTCNTTPSVSTGTWIVGVNTSLAGTISGTNTVCSGSGTTLTLAGHSGSIQWEKSSTLNGSYTPISSATSPTLSTGNLTAATFYRAAVTNGSCTTATSDGFEVSVTGTLSTITSISGPTTATLGTTITFSVPVDPNADSYVWDLPAGLTISSNSSNGAVINVLVAYNYTTGIIKVKSVNSCFSTPWQTKTVSAPGQAGISITTNQSGAPVICGGTSGVSFSATQATGATYAWTLPVGVTFASGYDGDEQTTQLNFAAGYVGGTISCVRTTATATNTAYYSVGGLATPGSISGPTALCDLTTGTYTVGSVPNATSYQWQLPTGMSGTSATSSITATWTGAVSGTVQVRATGTCGTSAWRTLSVGSTPTPSGITGPTIICGAATYTITGSTMTQVSQTVLNYSVTNVSGTTYNWSVPTGMTITSGNGTNAIVVEVDPSAFTSGQVSVTATSQSNTACVSSARTLNVSKAVSTITGPTSVCGITSATYSVPSGAGSAFSWTLPSWMTPASGYTLTSNPINVNIGSGPSTQTLSVVITTACGDVTLSQSVGCGLFTQLSAASCGSTLPSMGWGISANNVVAATSYQFTVTAPNGTDYTITSADRWITLGEATSMPLLYGEDYAIKVRVQLDGTYGAYGASCTVYTPSLPTTSLSIASCNTTLPSISSAISATNIVAATKYRFKITIPIQGATIYQVESVDRWIALSEAMNGTTSIPLLYGTTYSITVQVESGPGNWSAEGSPCSVTTPALPTTTLSSSFCDVNLSSISTAISASNIANAASYKFKISIPSISTTTFYYVESPDRWFALSEASNMPMLYGTTYSVRVSVQNGTGEWSDYANACTVTTPALPNTMLSENTSCGVTLTSLSTALSANNIAFATMYEFHITDEVTNEEYLVLSPDRWITLSEGQNIDPQSASPVLVPAWDRVYIIKVRIQNGSLWALDYGTECFVTTDYLGLAVQDPQAYQQEAEGIASEVIEAQSGLLDNQTINQSTWSATATSNPFEHSFKVNLSGAEAIDVTASFTATLTDMSGKVYTLQALNKEQLEAEHFGQNLAPGMYMLTLSQGTQVQVLRVVKR